jgi:hypothetical protein
MMEWARGHCEGPRKRPESIWALKLGVVIGAHRLFLACGNITDSRSTDQSPPLGSELAMGESRSVEVVELGKHFSEEELTTVARLIYGNKGLPEEEVDQVAEMLSTGVVVEIDHSMLTMLGLLSPELTTRVGKLRGQTEQEAWAWADAFLLEHGHPSTWEIKVVDEDEEEGEEYAPGDQ